MKALESVMATLIMLYFCLLLVENNLLNWGFYNRMKSTCHWSPFSFWFMSRLMYYWRIFLTLSEFCTFISEKVLISLEVGEWQNELYTVFVGNLGFFIGGLSFLMIPVLMVIYLTCDVVLRFDVHQWSRLLSHFTYYL